MKLSRINERKFINQNAMKKILLSVFIIGLVFFFACKKDGSSQKANTLQFVKTIPGGCATDSTMHGSRSFEPDTVIWHISNDSLSVFVGFNAECCRKFKTDENISNDTIYMNISLLPGPACNCLCYYTYDFLFTGINQPYYYLVTLPDDKTMAGYIEP